MKKPPPRTVKDAYLMIPVDDLSTGIILPDV